MKIVLLEGNREDRLFLDGKDLGRIDTLTKSELLCLLSCKGVFELSIKSE